MEVEEETVALGVERWFDGESAPLHVRFRHHSDHA